MNAKPPAPASWATLKISPPGLIRTLLILVFPSLIVMDFIAPPF